MVNIVTPVMIIVIANILLIVRVLWTKRNRQQSWRRDRKVVIRLLSIALIYIIFWLPLTFNGLVLTFTGSETSLNLQMNYFFFGVYMVPILIPYAASSLLKTLKRKIVRQRENRRIVPLSLRIFG